MAYQHRRQSGLLSSPLPSRLFDTSLPLAMRRSLPTLQIRSSPAHAHCVFFAAPNNFAMMSPRATPGHRRR